MIFISSGLGLKLALSGLTLNGTLIVIAGLPPSVAFPRSPLGERVAATESNLTTIKGNGVEFALPAGFQGGLPSSTETKTIVAETAKQFPAIASFMQVFDNDPAFLRAIAINTVQKDGRDLVLITRLPISESISLVDLREMMSKNMPSMLPPEFKLVNDKIAQIGARQIVQLTIDVDLQGAKLQESIGLFKEGDEIFQVTYIYTNRDPQQASSVFEQIISTFKAIPKTAHTTPPV